MGKKSPSSSPQKQKEYRDRFAAKDKVLVTEKTCSCCKETKSVESFNKMAASRDGLQSYCRSCANEKRRESLLAQYGLTPDSFDAAVSAQDGLCAICKKPPVRQGSVTWAIDHDHNHCPGETGCEECFRGLLCNSCNRAIGMLGDDPEIVSSALDYLTKGGADHA